MTLTPGGEYQTLLDVSTLRVIPKMVRPLERQLPHESRKLWEGVTSRLLRKEFGEATKEKVMIEQKQRDEAAERKRKGIE
jgi:oxysterol-binding protein-related protein 9/10/11